MKRIIAVVCVAAVVIGGLTLIPATAHAATVQHGVVPARGDTSCGGEPTQTCGPWQTGSTTSAHTLVQQQAKQVLDQYLALHPGLTKDQAIATINAQEQAAQAAGPGPGGAASVLIGNGCSLTNLGACFTDLIILNHSDLNATLTIVLEDGWGVGMGLLCAAIGDWLGGFWGAIFVGGTCAFFLNLEVQAVSSAMWAANAHVNTYGCVYWWIKCAPNAFQVLNGDWVYPVTDSGFNLLFLWGGILIAWQENDFVY